MNWLELYIKKNLLKDLIIRAPFYFKDTDLKNSMKNYRGKMEVTFSKLKNKDDITLFLSSILNDFSNGNKVLIVKKKGFSSKKVYRLSVKFRKNDLLNFLDFFLNLIIKGLKRRFLVLKTSLTLNGILNLRFSSLSELEIDDYFFFDIDDWSGFLNIFLNLSAKNYLNKLLSLYFINVFNLKKFSRYEIFSGKG